VIGEVRALLELSLGFESEATGGEKRRLPALLLGAHPRDDTRAGTVHHRILGPG
jgi:hypothetical protein